MRVGLISKLGPGAKVGDLQGYNQVMAFFIHRELQRCGWDPVLVPDAMMDDIPDMSLDAAIAISSVALRLLAGKNIGKMLETEGAVAGEPLVKKITAGCRNLFWMSDGPLRSIIPWGKAKVSDGAYVGMGADPDICPGHQNDTPVVLFNAWNATIDKGEFSDPMFQLQLAGAEFAKERGVEIWGMNCKPTCAIRYVGKDLGKDNPKLGYVKWLDVCRAYSAGWVFLDGTPKVIELGRVEAAVSGNTLLVPEVFTTDPMEGLQYLPQIYWKGGVDLGAQICRTVEAMQASGVRCVASRERALEWFSWPMVAKRLTTFLESYRNPVVQVPAKQSTDDGWGEEADVPGGKWVEYPLMVPPDRLYWQDGGRGLKHLRDSVHYRSAVEILQGTPPDQTEYAQRVKTQQAGVHGKPQKFADLVRSMKETGWKGDLIIAGIDEHGEIVIHDGWHRSAAALACGLKVIPVAVHYRCAKWVAFRKALQALNGGNKLYQPIDHPDFQGWPVWRKDTARRAEMIGNALRNLGVNSVIDVGCHSGALALLLNRKFLEVTGVDRNEKAIKAARMMSMMADGVGGGVKFEVGDQHSITGQNAVICLSALNHALVKGEEHGAKMLRELAAQKPILVLDCPVPGDPVGGDTKWADAGVFVGWVMSVIGGKASIIGTTKDGLMRPLILWKP